MKEEETRAALYGRRAVSMTNAIAIAGVSHVVQRVFGVT